MRKNVHALLGGFVIIAGAFGLSACAGPVFTVASFAVTGLSYAATGKGVADHALSAVANKDCQMLPYLVEGDLCYDDTEMADLESFEPASGPAGDSLGDGAAAEQAAAWQDANVIY